MYTTTTTTTTTTHISPETSVEKPVHSKAAELLLLIWAAPSVDDYAVFDVAGRYTTRVGDYDTVLHLTVDNLFLGAPRTARLSATVNF
ncbi:hypothetical protein [Pseudomonas reactans]